MPDAMGVACLLASLYFTTAQTESKTDTLGFRKVVGFFLAGILIGGIRLSYLPLLLPALLMQLKHRGRLKCVIAGMVGDPRLVYATALNYGVGYIGHCRSEAEPRAFFGLRWHCIYSS